MSARQTWVLAVAVVLAALTLGAFLGPRTAAHKADQPPSAVRYQLIPTGTNGEFVVMDAVTGHCWGSPTATRVSWDDLGSPADPKK